MRRLVDQRSGLDKQQILVDDLLVSAWPRANDRLPEGQASKPTVLRQLLKGHVIFDVRHNVPCAKSFRTYQNYHRMWSEVQIRASILSRSKHHNSHNALDGYCRNIKVLKRGYNLFIKILGNKS